MPKKKTGSPVVKNTAKKIRSASVKAKRMQDKAQLSATEPDIQFTPEETADVAMAVEATQNERAGEHTPSVKTLNKNAAFAFVIIAIAVVIGLAMIWRFASIQHQQSLNEWQIRLGLVADAQVSLVDSWIEDQYGTLNNLAENASLQVYMTELAYDIPATRSSEEPLQTSFLRNLIVVSAEKGGFAQATPLEEVPANVRPTGGAGLALIDSKNAVVVASRTMPPINGALLEFVKNTPAGNRAILDVFEGPTGKPTMAFLVPVFSIQGDKDPSSQIGVVLGVKPLDKNFYDLLKSPHTEVQTDESILVRKSANSLEYISPLQDGSAPLALKLDANTKDLAESSMLNKPGTFVEQGDYRSQKVLATGRVVKETGWILVHKVDSEEALAQSTGFRTRMIGIFLLVMAAVVVGVIAAWRHGASLRFQRLVAQYKVLVEKLKGEEHLLRLVTDNQADPMFIVDKENRYCFANLETAVQAGISVDDLLGKTLESVLGPQRVLAYKSMNRKALEDFETVDYIHKDKDVVVRSRHIPLAHVPSVIIEQDTAGVLVVEQDITEVITEREKQERTLRHLVDALVTVVDRRNPYATNHSARVGRLSRELAKELHLEDSLVDTAETAGKLMNLGKILLPSSLLVKVESLSKEEIKSVYESIYASADFLKDIEFKGPVVATLRQSQEHWDGSGSQGLKGEEILITARIIAVVNSFIAMVSPRAYRIGMDQEKALNVLWKEVGVKYDRDVVAGLINLLQNRKQDVAWWMDNTGELAEEPTNA